MKAKTLPETIAFGPNFYTKLLVHLIT